MCTRYYMEMNPELRPIVEKANRSSLGVKMVERLGKPLKTAGEIRPTDMVPVLAPNRNGTRSVFPMVWGYTIPGLDRPVVNARMESADKKDVWKEGWAAHRCIIPASYYFEWEHIPLADGKTKTGQKYMIQSKGSEMTWLAGIYRFEQFRDLRFPVFSIITKEPSAAVKRIHDRMPLILPSSAIEDWIKPDSKAEDVVKYAVTDVFVEEAR